MAKLTGPQLRLLRRATNGSLGRLITASPTQAAPLSSPLVPARKGATMFEGRLDLSPGATNPYGLAAPPPYRDEVWQELFGDPVIEPRRAFIIDKIMSRCILIDRGYKTRCLEWTGPTSGKAGRGRATGRGHSYPRITLFGCTAAVHRALWITIFGWLPQKKQLDHLCTNRLCVRPDHCEPVTHLLNQKRKTKR